MDELDVEVEARQLLNEAARLLAQRRPGEAAERLERARELAPNVERLAVAINLGGAYIMQRRYRQAVPILEEAAKRAPNNAMVWVNLAAAYLGDLSHSTQEMQDRAIAAYEEALRVDPLAANVNYNLGLIYKERGETTRAAAHFWRALEVNPQDEDARTWLRRLGVNMESATEDDEK